ncbi:hypothetical protein DPX39_000054300 [Trypanosoma brucei equiperdum]|uniref:Uncharacterized protein n=1 Tax=Trypanosoma brucei equiperdum TaxID=630700 RepID=A0A3L6KWH2_9TRYP|nr:hypothetical protein DPX39_000054300 [Trypanosoma brucei equiperdum]
MGPRIYPLQRESPSSPSARAIFERTRRMHAGTLNIFAENNGECDAQPKPQTPQPEHEARNVQRNEESQETREFGWPHLRRVRLPTRHETPQGLHQVPSAAGKVQHIQVVGVTDSYKDPAMMTPRRTGLRCFSRSHSTSMSEIMCHEERGWSPSLPASVAGSAPVSRSSSRCSSRGCRRVADYTPQERFFQAVRDHVQRRRGGATEFYVNLARGLVGSVPRSRAEMTPRPWRLDEGPVIHKLTLGSFREQSQSLTGIEVSLVELAQMVWGKEEFERKVQECPDEEQLASLRVTYREFSTAFGDSPSGDKFATFKI